MLCMSKWNHVTVHKGKLIAKCRVRKTVNGRQQLTEAQKSARPTSWQYSPTLYGEIGNQRCPHQGHKFKFNAALESEQFWTVPSASVVINHSLGHGTAPFWENVCAIAAKCYWQLQKKWRAEIWCRLWTWTLTLKEFLSHGLLSVRGKLLQ